MVGPNVSPTTRLFIDQSDAEVLPLPVRKVEYDGAHFVLGEACLADHWFVVNQYLDASFVRVVSTPDEKVEEAMV
jgi:hypothetical protein